MKTYDAYGEPKFESGYDVVAYGDMWHFQSLKRAYEHAMQVRSWCSDVAVYEAQSGREVIPDANDTESETPVYVGC